MKINKTMDEYKAKVDEALGAFFERLKSEAVKVHPFSVEVFEAVREFTMRGGKRIRPILMVFGYKCLWGRDEKEILKASCSLELMQSFLLIHDDIMDRSDVRRHKPTIHKIFEQRYISQVHDPEYFGLSMAILAGDMASQYATLAINEANFSPEFMMQRIG